MFVKKSFPVAVIFGLATMFCQAQTYQIIDTPYNGIGPGGGSSNPKVDDFGNNVVFFSAMNNLVAFDPNPSFWDVILIRRSTNARKLITQLVAPAIPNNSPVMTAESLAISGDGKTIAFISSASNLVSGDTNGYPDCFFVQVDDNLNITRPITRINGLAQPNLSCRSVSVNFDGSVIAFGSSATNIVAPATTTDEVYRYNVASGSVSLVSNYSNLATPPLISSHGYSLNPAINAYDQIAWQSTSDGLAAPVDQHYSYAHIFSSTGSIIRRIDTPNNSICGYLSVQFPNACGDHYGNGGSSAASISNNGSVVYASSSRAITPVGVAPMLQVYKNSGGTNSIISAQNGAIGNGISNSPEISALTNEIVFQTQATNLYTPDQNGNSLDILLRNGQGGLELINVGSGGGGVSFPDISAEGEVIVYGQNGGTLIGNPAPNIGSYRIVAFNRFSGAVYDMRTDSMPKSSYIATLNFLNVGAESATNAVVKISAPGEFLISGDDGACQIVSQSPKSYECRYALVKTGASIAIGVQNQTDTHLDLTYSVRAAGTDSNPSDNDGTTTLCARRVYCR